MAAKSSFDVSTSLDLQEVDNGVNQALKEIRQRFDFKGAHCEIQLERGPGTLSLAADDEYRINAILEVLRQKLAKRGVPLKNLRPGEVRKSGVDKVRLEIGLLQGIDKDTAKEIAKAFKQQKFKKAQISIQGDTLRVTSPSRDELQEVMQYLRSEDFGVELEFGNRR